MEDYRWRHPVQPPHPVPAELFRHLVAVAIAVDLEIFFG